MIQSVVALAPYDFVRVCVCVCVCVCKCGAWNVFVSIWTLHKIICGFPPEFKAGDA